MTFLTLLPAGLSLIVLGAHGMRDGSDLLALPALGCCALLFVRRPWAARTLQLVLLLGALEWVRTTVVLAGARMDEGKPWIRMVAILGVVAVICAASALALLAVPAKRWFRMAAKASADGAPPSSERNAA